MMDAIYDDNTPDDPARGCTYAIIFSAIMWIVLIVAALLVYAAIKPLF
jgi:hypothetical protein